MVLERKPWARRLLVVQLALAWPLSWMLWAGGGAGSLAVAVVVVWISTAASVTGIVSYRRAGESELVRRQ